jgi:hypothetical protein
MNDNTDKCNVCTDKSCDDCKIIWSFLVEAISEAGIDFTSIEVLSNDAETFYLAIDGKENNYNIGIWDMYSNIIRYSVSEVKDDTEYMFIEDRIYIIPKGE